MNLNNDQIVDNIINIVQTNKQYFSNLDLSWGSLTPRHLLKISEELK